MKSKLIRLKHATFALVITVQCHCHEERQLPTARQPPLDFLDLEHRLQRYVGLRCTLRSFMLRCYAPSAVLRRYLFRRLQMPSRKEHRVGLVICSPVVECSSITKACFMQRRSSNYPGHFTSARTTRAMDTNGTSVLMLRAVDFAPY